MGPKSLKMKIILSSVLCVVVVGIFSNAYLYSYLTGIISGKADRIDSLYLEIIQNQIDQGLDEYFNLLSLCANDLEIARAMRHRNLNTLTAKNDSLKAQESMNAYLAGCRNIGRYVDKLVVFNEEGLSIQTVTRKLGRLDDCERVAKLALFSHVSESGQNYSMAVSPSIAVENKKNGCVALLWKVENFSISSSQSWVYAELSVDYLNSVLSVYKQGILMIIQNTGGEKHFLAGTDNGRLMKNPPESLSAVVSSRQIGKDGRLKSGDRIYKINEIPLSSAGLEIYSCNDISFLAQDQQQILYTVFVLTFSSLAVAFLLAIILSGAIVRPLRRLTLRIQKISANDFSFDPEIEKSADEIGEVGKVVNEMSASIVHLLRETERMYEQRKNAEISLLQSQVNPHFLYNTLDSIHWMAMIQKNQGIGEITRGLSNLLKNLAKGVGDKISLKEELSLLEDYTRIQAIRYLETFEFVNNVDPKYNDYLIVKFTLQPLVENAIFHGIEPTGLFGTITLSVTDDANSLFIVVEDDGVGMTSDELEKLMKKSQNPHPYGLSGIGAANVNSRLKLVYGPSCGLKYESEKGKFTRAIVHIPKEVENVQSTSC